MKNRLLASLIALIVSTLFSFTQAQDINLTGYNLSFADEFNSLSLYNPATGTGTWKTNYAFGIQSAQREPNGAIARAYTRLQRPATARC